MYSALSSRWFPLLTAFVLLTTQASCFKEPKIYTANTEVTDDGKIIEKPRLVDLTQYRKEITAPGPKVFVDHSVHDFGRLDPLTTHKHVFVIRNRGDAPLELAEGPTTCKCTVANLVDGTVPPGGKVNVAMHWNTGRDVTYSHSATIYTNDPAQKIVRLHIKGEVEVLLRCEPAELVFSRVAPGETPSASALIYSQAWEDFDVTDIEPALPGLVHHLEEATEQERKQLGAATAYRLTVTLSEDLPSGYFTIPIHIQAKAVAEGSSATDEAEDNTPTKQEADCELTVQGKILRRLSVYGPAVDVQGTIMMGRIPQGKGTQLKLLLKMRDELTDLHVTNITTVPDSLCVRLEPYKIDADKDLGLYHLHVALPKDAPTFRLPPDQHGRICIEFTHPRVPQLDLPVDLIVTPRTDFDR